MDLKLTPAFERMVRGASQASADDVMQLSAFFHSNPGAATPWIKAFTLPAYVNYYLPLNYARLRAVFREVERFLPAAAVSEVWDYGSGPGTTHWVLEDEEWLSPRPFFCLEKSNEAVSIHKRLMASRKGRWQPEFEGFRRPSSGALAVFSYSFLEMQKNPPNLGAFDHLLIVEPSTRDCGRQLMQWRGRLMSEGFHVLAPCTHEQTCPLLEHSERDWCHMRVGFEAPEWWLLLEDELPMKNRTLTYSYLLLSRKVQDDKWRSFYPLTPTPARVTGDTLEERGKTRQMVCRGPEREFVSWLHREGPPPFIPHGALLKGLEGCDVKGAELRVNPSTHLQWVE
ncbi:MAG: hypothetical protein KF799_14370 [Bdellovibrionales bacterium]|nr:hypothetical protein [Bdellovibrionales bacterium]